jgi:hypothetical protein
MASSALYSTPGCTGSPGRIDNLFGGDNYKRTFVSSPLVFRTFSSLHSARVTLEALFILALWPQYAKWTWAYATVLYWSTMYLSYH